MEIKAIHDPNTATISYIVWMAETLDAIVIDPVWDYNPIGSRVSPDSVTAIARFIEAKSLKLHYILETHPHADHLSGAQELKKRFPSAQVAISKRITAVQRLFTTVFDLPHDFPVDGSQFDLLLEDRETLQAGELAIQVLPTPGHTPACTSFLIDDAVFTGDALFMPDIGTGRCDFPGGSASDLYKSVTSELFSLPDATRVFVGHDYPPDTRELAWESTIAEQKASNKQLTAETTEHEFLAFRKARDASLAAPKLLFQSVQVNIDAGRLPGTDDAHQHFLKIPVRVSV